MKRHRNCHRKADLAAFQPVFLDLLGDRGKARNSKRRPESPAAHLLNESGASRLNRQRAKKSRELTQEMPQTARIRASADSVAEAVVVARVVLVLEAQLRRAGHHYLTTDIASETGTAASKVARLAPRVVAAWNARHPARPITYRNAERRPEHLGGYQRARFEEVRA